VAAVLVAVAGSATVVASHANAAAKKHYGPVQTTSPNDPIKKNKSAVPKPGYLVIYSARGQFNSVKIHLEGNPSFPHKCNSLITPSKDVIKTLPTPPLPKNGGAPVVVKFLKLSCSPVSNDGAYQLSFGEDKKFKHGASAVVDIDSGYCTLVHPGHPELDSKFQAGANGSCPGADTAADTPVKIDVVVNAKPKLNTKNDSVTGYIEVKAASGEGMTRAQCTGQVTAKYTSVKYGTVAATKNLPLKYTKPASGPSYCVAKLPKIIFAPDSFILHGIENGTAYFNPAQGNSAAFNVTLPGSKKHTTKKNTTKHNTTTSNGGAAS